MLKQQKRILVVLIIGFALGLSGCTATDAPMTKELAFEKIDSSEGGAGGARQNYVITNSSEWANLWKKFGYYEKPPPTLDFKKDMVLAVFMGGRTSGGYNIAITKIVPENFSHCA